MATYAIGDLQGCLKSLKRLLSKLDFSPSRDHLWFCGDLVNRGPDSLGTLTFVKNLDCTVVLGNHDLTLIAVAEKINDFKPMPHLTEILEAKQGPVLIDWLCHQSMAHHDEALGYTMVHAGVYPTWDLQALLQYAQEVENCLQGPQNKLFLQNMFGNEPAHWKDSLESWPRLRFITNSLTRMRYLDATGALEFTHTHAPDSTSSHLRPWYNWPNRMMHNDKVVFGHWAALKGNCPQRNVFALDTGCVWGNCLTALCLETRERISIDCTHDR